MKAVAAEIAMADAVTTSIPRVTVGIACYNSEAYLEAALASVLAQTLTDFEIIVVDDASTDASVSVARRFADADPRVRVDMLETNTGPGGARNRILQLARGKWYAVLDSDDLYHPERLQTLVTAAERDGLDIVADNLVLFQRDVPAATRSHFIGVRSRRSTPLDLLGYLKETRILISPANLGFVKPLIRVEALRASGVAYDATMRIAEDDDLLMRLLASGLKAATYPQLTYFYRKHEMSISHRLDEATIGKIVDQVDKFRAEVATSDPVVLKQIRRRREDNANAASFVALLSALKSRRYGRAVKIGLSRPTLAPLLRLPIGALLGRLAKRLVPRQGAKVALGGQRICVISRQRLIGAVNGSSTYLLELVRHLRACGYEPHLLQPSPAVLGRWPVMSLKPEMAVFESIQIRGVLRFGRHVVSRDPTIWFRAALAGTSKLLQRLSLPTDWLGSRPAGYVIAAPWARADFLYVAQHAPALADRAVLLDYLFQVDALPFFFDRQPPSAIIMHDLFHARAARLTVSGVQDNVSVITADLEMRQLSRADAVIAIQEQEAAWVREHAPSSEVLLVPLAARTVMTPQPGKDDTLLFVGSNTSPNLIGLEWFFDHVWPIVRLSRPEMTLKVAGSVARGLVQEPPKGVRVLGVAPSLEALYSEAGVVISPLTVGSGLKIKLIEAVAAGKAMVVTSTTLQGVEHTLGSAVVRADDPAAFARGIVELAADVAERRRLGALALDACQAHFSTTACYEPMTRWLEGRPRQNYPVN